MRHKGEYMNNIDKIKNSNVYKEILKDSFGGVMYDIANRPKYNATELIELWDSASANDKEMAGGIVKGAIDFIKGDN